MNRKHLARLLDVLAHAHAPPTPADLAALAARWGVSICTIRRDLRDVSEALEHRAAQESTS
jgi:predicted DNA-binding transcriptional regulator YafY